MKYILFLLFSLSIYAQDTIPASKSVIALDRMNVVYRGIANPISIAVNDAKSYKIYGNGVSKNEDGKYILSPGIGLIAKVFVEITNFDDSIVIEEHEFRIDNLYAPFVKIDNRSCINCILKISKNDLSNATITAHIPNLKFEIKFPRVISFDIEFSNKKTITVNGNIFPKEILNKIKNNSKVKIFNIKLENDSVIRSIKVNGIELLILDDKK
jgi:hypothetical protein